METNVVCEGEPDLTPEELNQLAEMMRESGFEVGVSEVAFEVPDDVIPESKFFNWAVVGAPNSGLYMTHANKWEEEVVDLTMVAVNPVYQATPLEELLVDVGLVNVEASYHGQHVPHDFRWTGEACNFLLGGNPVTKIVYPPSKQDILPETVSQNLSRNVKGRREVVTGQGRHLFMGAIPCDGEPEVVFRVETQVEAKTFRLTRTKVEQIEAAPVSWRIGGTLIFDEFGGEKWKQSLQTGHSAMVLIDGNYWYAPRQRSLAVISTKGKIVDRKGTDFGLPHKIPDGIWEIDLENPSEYRATSRPVASYEIFRAWQKYRFLHACLYEKAPAPQPVFLVSPEEYSILHAPQCYNTNSQLMSMHMRCTTQKVKGSQLLRYLRSGGEVEGKRVPVDVFGFYRWSLREGMIWSTMDKHSSVSYDKQVYGGIKVNVPPIYWAVFEKAGARRNEDGSHWLLGGVRATNFLSCFAKPGVRFKVTAWRRLAR